MAILVGATAGNNGGGGTSLTLTVSSPTGHWTAGAPLDASNSFFGVAYGGGYWVAVGNNGRLYWTTDPTGTWTQNNQGTTNFGRHGVVYGNGYWVVVGASGVLYYATDPTGVWTSNTQGSTQLTSVAYGNGYFVAVGASGTLLYHATDPTGTWTSNAQGSVTFRGAAYVNGYWVAVGDSGTLWYHLTDPTGTWTQNNQGSTALYDLDYDGTRIVIAGLTGTILYRSTDPTGAFTSNQQGGGTPQFTAVAYGNGYWIAPHDTSNTGEVYYAADPTGTWTSNATGYTVAAAEDVIFAGGYWLSVGDTGQMSYMGSVLDNDVLLMQATVVGGTGTTITATGWQLLNRTNSGTALAQGLYWRLAASEPASYALTITSNKASGVIAIIRNAETTQPVSAQYAGQANASSLTVTYPTLSTWTSTDGVDSVFGGIAQADTPAAPTNYTQTVTSQSTGGGASSRTTSEHAFRALSAVTTVGQVTATWTGTAAVNIGHHVFIKTVPAAVSQVPYVNPMPSLLAQ